MGAFTIITPKENTAEVRPVQQKKQYKFLGNDRKVKGLRLYEVEIATLNIGLATPVKTAEVVDAKAKVRKVASYIFKDDHLYIQSMNEANALRKAKKFILKHNLAPQNAE